MTDKEEVVEAFREAAAKAAEYSDMRIKTVFVKPDKVRIVGVEDVEQSEDGEVVRTQKEVVLNEEMRSEK